MTLNGKSTRRSFQIRWDQEIGGNSNRSFSKPTLRGKQLKDHIRWKLTSSWHLKLIGVLCLPKWQHVLGTSKTSFSEVLSFSWLNYTPNKWKRQQSNSGLLAHYQFWEVVILVHALFSFICSSSIWVARLLGICWRNWCWFPLPLTRVTCHHMIYILRGSIISHRFLY